MKKQLSNYLLTLMKKHQVGVAGFALIDANQILSAETLSVSPNSTVTADSLFQACSLSKCITAYAALTLATENKLQLDASLNAELNSWQIPESQFGNETNMRQCLSMTSGLCYGELGTSFPGYTQDQPVPNLKAILEGVPPTHNPPIKMGYQPGTAHHYSGASYMVTQQLIEDKSGQSFQHYIDQIIFKPLEMIHSTFECPLNEEKISQAIPGFSSNGEMIPNGWENIVNTASGGLWSTPSDLAHFILALTNAYLGKDNRLISQSLAKEMLTRQDNSIFGLGVVVDGQDETFNFRKNGHNCGYHNQLIMFPHIGKGIVVMTNTVKGIALINDFIAWVAERHQWPTYSFNFDELNPSAS